MTLAVLLGLGAAFGFGVGDYLGGLYARRHGILPILVLSQLAGTAVLLAVAIRFSPPITGPTDLAWGAVAGVVGVGGGWLLFHGFRVGRLSVVAPVSSLTGAGIPLLYDLLFTGWPPAPALAGMLAGLVAIWLISTGTPDARAGRRGIATGFWSGLGAGICFAAFFLTITRADPDSGAWPVIASQVVMLTLLGLAMLTLRERPSVPLVSLPGVAATGIVAAGGTVAFLFAAHVGLVSIAAVIASLSPGVTVLLARAFMAEYLPARQLAGLLIAAIALVLIGMG